MYQFVQYLLLIIAIFALQSNQQVNDVDDMFRNRFNIFQWLFGPVIPHPAETTTTTTTQSPSTTHQPEITEKCENCTCGLTNKNHRIVGGQETEINEYPWMALLLYSGRFYCGASLINNRYVVTAAHCTTGFKKEKITVRLLEHDRKKLNETVTIDRGVSEIVRHENYSTRNFDSDIALLKLNQSVKFDEQLRPVCLPCANNMYAGRNGIVTGWGAVNQSGPVAIRLNEVKVPILSHEECTRTGYTSKRITKNMLCAGYLKGGMDSCQGDSGGPMHVEKDKEHKIVGVVSWGEGCAKPNYPGVYVRVGNFLDWILENTKTACYCQPNSNQY